MSIWQWSGFFCALIVLAALVLLGLTRACQGNGEILGQAFPAPFAIRAAKDRVDLHFYDTRVRLTEPIAVKHAAAWISAQGKMIMRRITSSADHAMYALVRLSETSEPSWRNLRQRMSREFIDLINRLRSLIL